MTTRYRACTITYDPPPIPYRGADYRWVHDDYTGPGDRRHGCAASVAAAQAEIDEWYAVYADSAPCGCAWENGQWDVCAQHRCPHSQHTTPAPGCLSCEDDLADARQLEHDAPWNDA